jgi:hypothetical protein
VLWQEASLAEADALRERLSDAAAAGAAETRRADSIAAERDDAVTNLAAARAGIVAAESRAAAAEAAWREKATELARKAEVSDSAAAEARFAFGESRAHAAAAEQHVAQLVQNLQGELEKRLDELTSVMGERDRAVLDTQTLAESLATQERSLQEKERALASAYAADRQRLTKENEVKTARMADAKAGAKAARR